MSAEVPSYIIHSGWWCDESNRHIGSAYNQSDDRTRSPLFFDVWYDAIRAVSDPQKIIVVDSASPVKPDLTGKDVEFVSMRRNFLHGMICDTQFNGWTRAFATGAWYAYMNDADYSVFVEQDCLLVGKGAIERAIEHMGRRGISYGAQSPVRIEQSLVIMRRDYIPKFLRAYLGYRETDRELFTEVKFQRIQKRNRLLSLLGLAKDEYVPLPFGFGRLRPLDFNTQHWYAQHWESAELAQLHEQTGYRSLARLLADRSPANVVEHHSEEIDHGR